MGTQFTSDLPKMKLAVLSLGVLLLAFGSLAEEKVNDEIDALETLNDPSWIGDWLKRWKDYLSGKAGHPDAGKKCQETKDDGEVPSAEHGDSPVKQFGFPHFNEGSQSTTLIPGVTLSYMFGKRQPIKIGSRDYVIAGFPSDLMEFFKCFEDYEIIGKSLGQDGRWTETGAVQVQLQNLNPRPGNMQSDLWEMLFKISLDRIIKYLNPVKIITGMDAKIFGSKKAASSLNDFEKMLKHVKKWLPGGEELVAKIFDLFKRPCPACPDTGKDDDDDTVCKLMKLKCLKEKGKELIAFWKAEEARLNELRKKWVGWDSLSKTQKIMLTLTMYAKPEHGARATFNTGKSRMKLGDIAKALVTFFDKQQPQ